MTPQIVQRDTLWTGNHNHDAHRMCFSCLAPSAAVTAEDTADMINDNVRATAGNRIYSSWVGSCHGNPQQTQCLTQSAQWKT